MKRLNITNLLFSSICLFVGLNSKFGSDGFDYLGKYDAFLLGIITGYYIGYVYNSNLNLNIVDGVDLEKAKDFQTVITIIILGLLNLASHLLICMSFLFLFFISILYFIFRWWPW